MNINRNNYEEFFLLYVDHELSAAERKAVDAFVNENTDLGEELRSLQHSKLQPDNTIIFENKKSLLKHPSGNSLINEFNYEEFFVLYIDGELSDDERTAVQEFVLVHPNLKQELDLLQQACLVPDLQVVFEGKEILYREEKEIRAIPLPWFRMAAAAILLLIAGLLVFKYAGVPASHSIQVKEQPLARANNSSPEKNQATAVTPGQSDSLHFGQQVEKGPMVKPTETLAKNNPGSKRMKKQAVAYPDQSLSIKNKEPKHESQVLLPVPSTENLAKENRQKQIDPVPNTLLAAADHPAIIDVPVGQPATDNGNKMITYTEMVPDPENGVSILTSTSSGKNKMRGFFRKVSRVFEKRTGIDNENSNHSVLVGNFQIALK